MEVLEGHNWKLYVGDCRDAMAVMLERSVHCVVSSPPYWGLRDYGIPPVDWQDGERCVFGLESTVQGYIRHTMEIFDGLRRVLRDDGVIWWNVGDTFLPSGSKGLVPHRVAIELQSCGWCVRQDNVWGKRSPMPERVKGWQWLDGKLRKGSWRTTNAHEFIFMVTKGDRYFADGDAVAERSDSAGKRLGFYGNRAVAMGCKPTGNESKNGEGTRGEARNPRSVWMLAHEPYKGAHFACFPTEIPLRCISAATSSAGCCSSCGSQYAPIVDSERVPTRPANDSKTTGDRMVDGNRDPQRHVSVSTVQGYRASCDCNAEPDRPTVFDPFNGSGTTGQVARHLGRKYIGCEINPTYARELAAVRIETPLPDRTKLKRRKIHKQQRSLFAM